MVNSWLLPTPARDRAQAKLKFQTPSPAHSSAAATAEGKPRLGKLTAGLGLGTLKLKGPVASHQAKTWAVAGALGNYSLDSHGLDELCSILCRVLYRVGPPKIRLRSPMDHCNFNAASTALEKGISRISSILRSTVSGSCLPSPTGAAKFRRPILFPSYSCCFPACPTGTQARISASAPIPWVAVQALSSRTNHSFVLR